MGEKSEVELLNFFVFNPTYSVCEGEEEKKILYFHPPQTDIDTQLKNAGLCEALIKFTGSFSPSKPCQSFTTEKTKQFLYEAEENFWLVLTVRVPFVTKPNGVSGAVEYQSWKIQENVYNAVLVQAYRMFKLFNGSFKSIEKSEIAAEDEQTSIDVVKQKLDIFFSQYVGSWKLAHCDILDVFNGISFLPLSKEPFLHVQSFVNLVETTFEPVRYSAFLYNDQLVWSGIEPEDMQVLYQYLIHTLLPQHPDLELQGGSLPSVGNSIHHYGSFVTGPSNLKDSIVSTRKVPTVHLCSTKTEQFHLVVYRALSATLCLFMNHDEPLTLDLFKRLDAHLGPRLTTLVSEVTAHCARQASVSTVDHVVDDAKYVYYNSLNLAQKSTVHVETKQTRGAGGTATPTELLRIVADVNADKAGCEGFGEVIMKTLNDCWLVGKFSNSREFYVILTQRKANLVNINDEVKRVCDSQLKGIFFMD